MLSYKCTTEYPVRAGEVQFGLLSSEEIRAMSTVQVKDTTIYYRGLPNPYGINDHRMGTVDRRLLCGTCGRDVKECQGHVGHIELSYPMYHIGFFDMTFKTLRCVCFTCSKLLLTAEEVSNLGDDDGKTRFQTVYNHVKTRKKCLSCGMLQPAYTRLALSIKCDWPQDHAWESEEERIYYTAPFTARDALSILTHVPSDDAAALGFNRFCRPRDLILLVVLVPPPVARPAIMASEGSRSRGQDDLTHKLQDINKRSIELQTHMGESTWRTVTVTPELQERIAKLQFEVFTYMNNNIRGQKQSTQRSGAPTKSITDRLKGKDGRIRGNLMGKRVDFSARSVITPDAVMDVDQVGIPYKVAMSLTVPERVTSYNIKELSQRIANGASDIFGAETVTTSSGVMINLAHCDNRDKIRLQFGWVVERFLTDNDVVIFNRQPSLHKVGMMGHRVKLMPGNTFRLNLCCANPYNADFDGDEMNLHVPQSPAAKADVASIMMVARQIISPQANRPVMGIVQDCLLGAHLMSCDGIYLTREEACHVCAHLKYTQHDLPPPAILLPVELWTGKQLLSMLLPPTFRMSLIPTHSELKEHTRVVVVKGRILMGVLKKATLGTSAGGFVDLLYRQYGSSTTVRWMSDLQRLVNAWLCLQGFCVGVKDCVLGGTGESRVKDRITTAMRYATELVNEPVDQGTDEAFVLEGTVVRILSKCLMHTGGIVDEELGASNSIRKMVQAGSKGNPINLSQICGCVGQQSVEGRRVFAEKGGRTLSCFDKDDKSLAGCGFVENSYALGLHPHEYFFHAMGGREGLVDTAVKTATTGYIQRRQMKSMEDHKVCYDGTVRNAEEAIIDFAYGGDGMDATRVERISLAMLEQDETALASRFLAWELELVVAFRRQIILCKKQRPLDTRVLLPFSPVRIHLEPGTPRATPEEISGVLGDFLQSERSVVIRASILEFFNTRKLVEKKVSIKGVRDIMQLIKKSIAAARVNYGEMVGSIAAQSIGEPCTQMTLNTFHLSGVGNKSVTLGIPRLKELLDQAKQIKTPSCRIYFKNELAHSSKFATYFAATLPLTRLGDIVASCDFVYDPDPSATVVEADAFMVKMNEEVGYPANEKVSRYVIRLILNQSVMKARQITPPMVRSLLRNRLHRKAHILSSETNAVDWTVRVRFERVVDMMSLLDDRREREGLLCHRVVSVMLDTIAISGHIHISAAHTAVEESSCGKTVHVVDTMGCCLIDLSAADCVDWYQTTSNDINEVHAALGIEAATNVIFSELMATISFDGTYVDPRHMMMIVNTMTRGGYIMPLSRHGINRMDTGPLLRCSFEETPDILCDAACFGEQDNGRGVSQNIMTGKLPEIGTGLMAIKVSPSMMHPRETLHHNITHKRKVLKSTVRRRDILMDQIDLHELQRSNIISDSRQTTIEVPFACHDDAVSVDNSDGIFSSNECQVPYNDTLADVNKSIDYAPPVRTKKEYRPSTPVSDDSDG